MYLMIDNRDSFVYNLVSYFRETGRTMDVVRCDRIDIPLIRRDIGSGKVEGIVLSPGPGRPSECGECLSLLEETEGSVPILGVCLGHQIIGSFYGADVTKGERPMHGKVTPVTNDGTGLFSGLPERFDVTRYHSLVVSEDGLPDCLKVDARSDDGAVMAISHRSLPIHGVQFHPEAVLTQYGHEIIGNFIGICEGSL